MRRRMAGGAEEYAFDQSPEAMAAGGIPGRAVARVSLEHLDHGMVHPGSRSFGLGQYRIGSTKDLVPGDRAIRF